MWSLNVFATFVSTRTFQFKRQDLLILNVCVTLLVLSRLNLQTTVVIDGKRRTHDAEFSQRQLSDLAFVPCVLLQFPVLEKNIL